MRILFLTQVLPYPLDAGPKLRAYYVIRHLAREHEVTLLSFTRDEDKPESIDHLRRYCASVVTVRMERSTTRTVRAIASALLHDEPVIIRRDAVAAMHRQIDALFASVGSFDAVHADQTSMVQYALYAASNRNPRPRLVLDAHNALHQVFRRLGDQAENPLHRRLYHWEAARLAAYEVRTYAAFDDVVFVTAVDREHFDLPASQVIPICVEPPLRVPCVASPETTPEVLFVGTLFWPPNAQGITWFLTDVWPRVLSTRPHARINVVGKRPPPELAALAATTPNVILTGYVADLTPLVATASLFAVPLHAGGGMRVKIVDAWSWGIPVVSTTVGAEGLDYRADEHLLLADDAATFAAAVIRLLDDPLLARRLADAGRGLVDAAYDWRTAYAAWDRIYAPDAPCAASHQMRESLCN